MFKKRKGGQQESKSKPLNLDDIADTEIQNQKEQNDAHQTGSDEEENKIYKAALPQKASVIAGEGSHLAKPELKEFDDQRHTNAKSLTAEYSRLKQALDREEDDLGKRRDARTEMQKMLEKNALSSKYFSNVGPVRVANTIKHTNTIDYNPSRCKDFHEAGYCARGDSCIFIHDRCDYKFGWEQEKDWEAKQKRKTERRMRRLEDIQNGKDEDELSLSTDEEGYDEAEEPLKYGEIDPKCFICSGQYKEPTLLECGHIFCEPCAKSQYGKTGKCAKCNKRCHGIFNSGARILEKAILERNARKIQKMETRKNRPVRAELPMYLQELQRGPRFNGMKDSDEPVVVASEHIEKALERIRRGNVQEEDQG